MQYDSYHSLIEVVRGPSFCSIQRKDVSSLAPAGIRVSDPASYGIMPQVQRARRQLQEALSAIGNNAVVQAGLNKVPHYD